MIISKGNTIAPNNGFITINDYSNDEYMNDML